MGIAHECVCSCAITTFAAQRRLMQPRYPGGSPYGSSQSDADGIAATSFLMRSNLALMSDSKRWVAQQSDRQQNCTCTHSTYIQLLHILYICVSVKLCRHTSAVFVFFISCWSVRECWGKPVVLWAPYMAPRPSFSEAKKMLYNH